MLSLIYINPINLFSPTLSGFGLTLSQYRMDWNWVNLLSIIFANYVYCFLFPFRFFNSTLLCSDIYFLCWQSHHRDIIYLLFSQVGSWFCFTLGVYLLLCLERIIKPKPCLKCLTTLIEKNEIPHPKNQSKRERPFRKRYHASHHNHFQQLR